MQNEGKWYCEMKINGKEIKAQEGATILSILESRNHNIDRVAAELNGKIIPKEQFATTALADSDTLEIVCFVGGG